MEDGYIEGFIVVLILGTIIGVVSVIFIKKQKKLKNNIISSMPQQLIDELMNSKFYICEDNPNFMTGKSYVYEIKQKDGGVEVELMYYVKPREKKDEPYHLDSLFISLNEFETSDFIKVGKIVNTIHNCTVMTYKVCKIIG